MKIAGAISTQKDFQAALQEAYRLALQKLGVLRADCVYVSYTYDHSLDPDLFTAILRKQFRDITHFGASTWSGWSERNQFEADTGVSVMAMTQLPEDWELLKVFSLKEKSELWAPELLKQLDSVDSPDTQGSLFLVGDGIQFPNDHGLQKIRQGRKSLKVFGYTTSYGIPQCSVVINGELYSNALVALYLPKLHVPTLVVPSVCPELQPIRINRMSENLVIEIDEKPAFYRLSEHLMASDDLPMMAPDEFRKYMGNLFLAEKRSDEIQLEQHLGDIYRVVSLLGSEMTTGMVAVGEELDFESTHYLAQKKNEYSEDRAKEKIQEFLNEYGPFQCLLMFASSSHFRDKERRQDDISLVRQLAPSTPLIGVSSQAEIIGSMTQQSFVLAGF